MLTILKALPDDADFPHELITSIRLPMLTQADVEVLGKEERHRRGIETGPDMRPLTPVLEELNRRFTNKVASFRYPLQTGINLGQTIDDAVGATMAMWNARRNQDRVNTVGGDKYWHAYGNAAATMSPIGAFVAEKISNFVENLNAKTDDPAIIQNDQTANGIAR